jgi:hypothetical protein
MDIEQEVRSILRETPPPPGLPENLKSAREFAHWAAVLAVVITALFLLYAVWNLVWVIFIPFNIIWVGMYFVLAFVEFFIIAKKIKEEYIPLIDAQNISAAKEKGMLLFILGLIIGTLPGLFMLLSYLKLEKAI